jgi:hypothetical protein
VGQQLACKRRNLFQVQHFALFDREKRHNQAGGIELPRESEPGNERKVIRTELSAWISHANSVCPHSNSMGDFNSPQFGRQGNRERVQLRIAPPLREMTEYIRWLNLDHGLRVPEAALLGLSSDIIAFSVRF